MIFLSVFSERGKHTFPTRRSSDLVDEVGAAAAEEHALRRAKPSHPHPEPKTSSERDRGGRRRDDGDARDQARDRKSTRLNSSHLVNSYAVFCLKKKKMKQNQT